MPEPDDEVTQRTEAWFLGRGLPHFIADYDAGTRHLDARAPALTLLFLFEIVALAPNREFPLWLDVVVVAAIFGWRSAAWAFVNRARPPRVRAPRRLGPIEVAAFVVVPALVPLVVGGQVRAGGAHRAWPTWSLLGAIYVVDVVRADRR